MDLQQLQNLLSASGAGGAVDPNAGKNVSFKAGRMTLNGTTVTADPRKGQVLIEHSADGLLQFKWQTRPQAKVEREFMIVPDTATWEKVSECKDGRCFLLRMKATGSKHFFWMQEPKTDKDEEQFKKINELFSSSPQAAPQGGLDQAALISMIGQNPANQNQSSTVPSSAVSPSSQPQSSTVSQQGINAAAAAAAIDAFLDPKTKFLLSDGALSKVIDPEVVIPLINGGEKTDDDKKSADIEELLPFLPAEHQSVEDLHATLRSPQLQQALGRLQTVLGSTECGGLLTQLGLTWKGMGIDAFFRSIEELVEKEKDQAAAETTDAQSQQTADAQDTDNDTEMTDVEPKKGE